MFHFPNSALTIQGILGCLVTNSNRFHSQLVRYKCIDIQHLQCVIVYYWPISVSGCRNLDIDRLIICPTEILLLIDNKRACNAIDRLPIHIYTLLLTAQRYTYFDIDRLPIYSYKATMRTLYNISNQFSCSIALIVVFICNQTPPLVSLRLLTRFMTTNIYVHNMTFYSEVTRTNTSLVVFVVHTQYILDLLNCCNWYTCRYVIKWIHFFWNDKYLLLLWMVHLTFYFEVIDMQI